MTVLKNLFAVVMLCACAGVAGASVIVMDNGDVGYSENGGSWWHGTDGYQDDQAAILDGVGANATYQFDGLTPGDYYVRTTYVNAGNRNTAVPYTMIDGTAASGSELGTVYVNQKYTPPSGYSYDGWEWDELGTFSITGSTLTVRIDVVPGEGFSMCDGVMIEAVPEPVTMGLLLVGLPLLVRRR